VLGPAPRHLIATWILHASRVDLCGDLANAIFTGLTADDGGDGDRSGQARARNWPSRAQKRRRARRRVILARIARRARQRVILARIAALTLNRYAADAARGPLSAQHCHQLAQRIGPDGQPAETQLIQHALLQRACIHQPPPHAHTARQRHCTPRTPPSRRPGERPLIPMRYQIDTCGGDRYNFKLMF
jgi:hypothetical protein